MNRVVAGVNSFKNPAYTGANRCLPCTAVNLCIGFVLAAIVELGLLYVHANSLALPAAVVVFVLAVAIIYFRGYLVPGTPELTKRYLPPWVLSLFGKEPEVNGLVGASQPGDIEDIDVESILLDSGVVVEEHGGEDLQLTEAFADDLETSIETVDDADATREQLLAVLGVDAGEVAYSEHGDAFRVMRDGRPVGTWESRPAFLADLGAARLFTDRISVWDDLAVEARGQLLNGLRLFLRTCPGCGGNLELGMETVESCCSTHDVAAVSCDSCGARLFESNMV